MCNLLLLLPYLAGVERSSATLPSAPSHPVVPGQCPLLPSPAPLVPQQPLSPSKHSVMHVHEAPSCVPVQMDTPPAYLPASFTT